MGYLHIENLYRNKDILLFKECYALEKIHGTSAHISWKENKLTFFSGGEKYANFIALFNAEELKEKFIKLGILDITFYGEAYGGKQQGMRLTYGDKLKFIVFDVNVFGRWLCVPEAEQLAMDFGLEFVHYELVNTDIKILDGLCSAPSVQAKRNGILENKIREGIVLRPLIELTKNNKERIISKHKNEKFKEREHPPKLQENNQELLTKINQIIDEWVTEMRLSHILGKLPEYSIEDTKKIIQLMQEDVLREAKDEYIVENNKELLSAIGKRTAKLFIQRLRSNLEK